MQRPPCKRCGEPENGHAIVACDGPRDGVWCADGERYEPAERSASAQARRESVLRAALEQCAALAGFDNVTPVRGAYACARIREVVAAALREVP